MYFTHRNGPILRTKTELLNLQCTPAIYFATGTGRLIRETSCSRSNGPATTTQAIFLTSDSFSYLGKDQYIGVSEQRPF